MILLFFGTMAGVLISTCWGLSGQKFECLVIIYLSCILLLTYDIHSILSRKEEK